MTLSGVDKLYWAVGYAGSILLLLILIFRKYTKAFPAFSSLIAFAVIRTTVLLCIHLRFGKHAAYFYTFWSFGAVDLALQLAVVYEIAARVFRPLGYWAPDVKSKAFWWSLTSIAVAVFLTWLPRPEVKFWYQSLILKGSFFSSALECALVVGIAALSWNGGFPWSSAVARIAVGFVVFAFPDMVVEIATTRFGLKNTDVLYQSLERVRMSAYLCSLIFWNVALWMKLPSPRQMNERMSGQLNSIKESVDAGVQVLKSKGETQ